MNPTSNCVPANCRPAFGLGVTASLPRAGHHAVRPAIGDSKKFIRADFFQAGTDGGQVDELQAVRDGSGENGFGAGRIVEPAQAHPRQGVRSDHGRP